MERSGTKGIEVIEISDEQQFVWNKSRNFLLVLIVYAVKLLNAIQN